MTTKITGDNITDGSVTTDDLNAAAKSSGATDGNAFNIGVLGFKIAVNEGLTIFNLVDGIVDAPDTVGKMLGEKKFNELKKIKTANGIINPEKIAETYLHLVRQHPSAWTFEMDIRSQNELAWWNSESRNV